MVCDSGMPLSYSPIIGLRLLGCNPWERHSGTNEVTLIVDGFLLVRVGSADDIFELLRGSGIFPVQIAKELF